MVKQSIKKPRSVQNPMVTVIQSNLYQRSEATPRNLDIDGVLCDIWDSFISSRQKRYKELKKQSFKTLGCVKENYKFDENKTTSSFLKPIHTL